MTSRRVLKRDWSRRGMLGGMSALPVAATAHAERTVECARVRLRWQPLARRGLDQNIERLAARMTQVLDEITTFGPAPDVVTFAEIPLSRDEPWTASDVRFLVAALADHVAPCARRSNQWVMFGCRIDTAPPVGVAVDPEGHPHNLNQPWDQGWAAGTVSRDAGCDEVVRVIIPATDIGRAVLASTNPRMIS